jgi:acetoin utilization deacetylase AcuC-like enzyme
VNLRELQPVPAFRTVIVFYSDHHPVPLPAGHRFPMPKYALLHQRLVEAGLPGIELLAADAARDDQLRLVHEEEYLQKVLQGLLSEKEIRRIGLPWSPELVERARRSVGGTIGACRSALQEGLAANLAGGTHHAYPDHGEGYCVFNDAAVAIRVLQAEKALQRAVILDCDVHQGNGTAAVFSTDASVFTFSIHGQKNFPFHKEPSSLDIGLPDGCDDDCFLAALEPGVQQAIQQAGASLAVYIAGADPFEGDQLGRMRVSKAGLLERDRLVFDRCRAAGLPLAIVMGGGYARDVEDTVDIHLATIRLAAQAATGWPTPARQRDVCTPAA